MTAARGWLGVRLGVAVLVIGVAGAAWAKGSSGHKAPADAPAGVQVSAPQHRFFLAGDGVLAIENAHTHDKVEVRYRDASGHYSQEALDKIDTLFRSRGDNAETRVSLRLLEVIDYLQDHEHPRGLLLVSGYRSEGYNAALIAKGGQAARTSMHSEGLAADLIFEGMDHHALWLRIRELGCCGAGYYKKSGFLHVDVGQPRFWEEATSKVKENISAGNARVLARTDYDRYGDLVGLETTVHGISLHPLRVSSRATLVAEDGGAELAGLTLVAPGKDATPDGCIVADGENGGARQILRVSAVEPRGGGSAAAPVERKDDVPVRARIALSTCEPRLEATPARIETNVIEASAAALQARRGAGG